MKVKRLEGEPVHDHRLDRYRRGVALVRDGDQVVGYLATRVETIWVVAGPMWRRRGVNPVERVHWLLAPTPGAGDRLGISSYVDELGDDVEAVTEEWNANRLELKGSTYQLKWLDGRELDEAWSAYGWD